MSVFQVFVTIKYDEENQDSYEGFEIHADDKIHTINTGDPVADHKATRKYIKDKYPEAGVNCSSSLTHFVFDGDKYKFDLNDRLVLKDTPEEPEEKQSIKNIISDLKNCLFRCAIKDENSQTELLDQEPISLENKEEWLKAFRKMDDRVKEAIAYDLTFNMLKAGVDLEKIEGGNNV